MIYVIGSGPASIAATMALVRRGCQVTILDAGKTLEPQKQEILSRLAQQPPEQWDPEDLNQLRGDDQTSTQGAVHVKKVYGSAFPYEDHGFSFRPEDKSPDFHYSMARGGLSEVWGASILPPRPEDIKDWPFAPEELEEHLHAVFQFLPSTARKDHLENLFPSYSTQAEPWNSSRQAEEFLQKCSEKREELGSAGINCGVSRMAVKVEGDEQRRACVYCGLCLYGCPYSLIYSSSETLERLIKLKQVTYIRDHVVQKLVPDDGGVLIHALNVKDQTPVVFNAERVFLGAGILPTAWLVLRSLGLSGHSVEMLDSQYFIYPFLRFRKTAGVASQPFHSLAQAFLEIRDRSLSAGTVHLEVFSYSDFLHRALLGTPLRWLLQNKWFAEQFLGRLLVLQGFLHSDDSSRLSVSISEEPRNMSVRQTFRWRSLWVTLKVGLKLLRHAFSLGGVPIIPGLKFAKAGRSYHTGGGFPMRQHPNHLETDRLGQLQQLPGVHIVDASVLPSIPATTMTLGVMANAHRIATEAVKPL